MFARLFKPVRAAAAAFPAKPTPPPPARTVAAADPFAAPAAPPAPPPPSIPPANLDQLAVIAGRDCLAYQGTSCTVCHDRCPVPGAILLEAGLPKVEPAVCIGCGFCHDVCPSPDNAVRVVPRPPGLPRPNSGAVTAKTPPPHSPFPTLTPRPDVDDV